MSTPQLIRAFLEEKTQMDLSECSDKDLQTHLPFINKLNKSFPPGTRVPGLPIREVNRRAHINEFWKHGLYVHVDSPMKEIKIIHDMLRFTLCPVAMSLGLEVDEDSSLKKILSALAEIREFLSGIDFLGEDTCSAS